VVQHDRSEQHADGNRHDFLIAVHRPPRPAEVRVIHPSKNVASLRDALIKSRNQLGGALGAWLLEVGHIHRRLRREFGDGTGDDCHVQRQLAERPRSVVRLPRKAIGWYALEHAARRLRFLFEFLQQEFDG